MDEVESVEAPLVDIAFDYIDPGSWLAWRVLSGWTRSEEVDEGRRHALPRIRWRPLELRPPGRPPVDPADPGWDAVVRAMAEEAGRIGVPFGPPPEVPRTRKAHELTLHAAERGIDERMRDALFRARFEEGLDVGRVDVLVGIAERLGLDGAECRTVLGVDRFRDAVEDERRELLAAGVRGVPTVCFDPGGADDRIEGFPGVRPFLDAIEDRMNERRYRKEGRWLDT